MKAYSLNLGCSSFLQALPCPRAVRVPSHWMPGCWTWHVTFNKSIPSSTNNSTSHQCDATWWKLASVYHISASFALWFHTPTNLLSDRRKKLRPGPNLKPKGWRWESSPGYPMISPNCSWRFTWKFVNACCHHTSTWQCTFYILLLISWILSVYIRIIVFMSNLFINTYNSKSVFDKTIEPPPHPHAWISPLCPRS